MNVLRIVEYPDPLLSRVAEPISHIDETVAALADDMIATLRYRA